MLHFCSSSPCITCCHRTFKSVNKFQHFEELLNVKCERQVGDEEEVDIKEQKEEIRAKGIRIEEVIEATYVEKGKSSRT